MDEDIKKPSFLVCYDSEVVLSRLTDEEAGRLFKSLFRYGKEGIEPEFSKVALDMAFAIFSMDIDKSNKRKDKQ